ncbi:MAG: hypothetical protein K2Y71_28715 [Xanthobacteraceae bacterium]|nr:hypothetical protein [Xanthobacteraceae bacterium]
MDKVHPQKLRCMSLALQGLLILLAAFAVPKLAFGQTDLTDQDIAWGQRSKVIHEGILHPGGRSLRLFAENQDCATVKLDIWLQRGTVTHSATLSDRSVIFRTTGGEKGRTMIIGGRDCRIRVRIEAVPADTSIFE